MEALTLKQRIAAWIGIVAFMAFMGWAAGEAWDHDGCAHSHEAFGTEYDCVEE